MVENRKFLNRLRNGHLEKSAVTGLFRTSRSPTTAKRLSRCTLNCGFKTSESPALRGFVGGSQALATAALYLVLKSNGPHRSKSLPVKFGFSPKIVPANIAKSYRCNAVSNRSSSRFSTSRTNGPRSLSRAKAGTHSALLKGSHTAAHTAKQGAFRTVCYLYPRTVSHVSKNLRG